MVSIAFCLRRRIAVHRRLQGISKSYKTLGKGDVPDVRQGAFGFSSLCLYSNKPLIYCIHSVGSSLYNARICSCLLDYLRGTAKRWIPRRVGSTWCVPLCSPRRGESSELMILTNVPYDAGSKYEDVQFRKRMLDTVSEIGKCFATNVSGFSHWMLMRANNKDKLAHEVIPRHPDTRPHTRMTHHFRFIAPLLPKDDIGLSALHYYDSGIQLARHSSREPAEDEFLRCMAAADQIKKMYVCFSFSRCVPDEPPVLTSDYKVWKIVFRKCRCKTRLCLPSDLVGGGEAGGHGDI